MNNLQGVNINNDIDFNKKILLNETKSILDKYKKNSIEKKYAGEEFNIFQILKVQNNEEFTHSAFLYELLNPVGSHGQSNLFLKLFIDEINIKDFKFDCNKIKIEKELDIGKIPEDKESGGKIDLAIQSQTGGRKAILIENKIYAKDQPKQLLRYYNYGINGSKKCKKEDWKEKFGEGNFKLLYLTLNGKKASLYSIGKNIRYEIITYESHIKRWLKKCCDEVKDKPAISEAISQYNKLIDLLINKEKTNEITDVILNNELNTKAFFNILNYSTTNKEIEYCKREVDYLLSNKKHIQAKIQHLFWIELEKSLNTNLNNVKIQPEYRSEDGKDNMIWRYYNGKKLKSKEKEFGIAIESDNFKDRNYRVALNKSDKCILYGFKVDNEKWEYKYLKIINNEKKENVNFESFTDLLIDTIVNDDNRKAFIETFVKQIRKDIEYVLEHVHQ